MTEDEVGTRFAGVTIRTFDNAGDPNGLAKAHALEDGILLTDSGGPFEAATAGAAAESNWPFALL